MVIYFVFNVAFVLGVCVVIIYLCGHLEESLRHGVPHRPLLLCSCLRVHDACQIDVSMCLLSTSLLLLFIVPLSRWRG